MTARAAPFGFPYLDHRNCSQIKMQQGKQTIMKGWYREWLPYGSMTQTDCRVFLAGRSSMCTSAEVALSRRRREELGK